MHYVYAPRTQKNCVRGFVFQGGIQIKSLIKIFGFLVAFALLAYFLYSVCYSIGTATIIIILISVIAVYGVLFDISQRSTLKLARIIDSDKRTVRQLITLSIGSMLPMYFCYSIVSFLPMFQYEVWLITVLPVIIIICVPLSVMAEELKRTHIPMIFYWLVHAIILIVSFAALQTVSNIVFETLI